MTPFANFSFFGLLLLYAVLPVLVLGWLGKASAKWCFVASLFVLGMIYSKPVVPGGEFRTIGIIFAYALWQGAISFAFLRWKSRPLFYLALLLTLLPLLTAKFLPLLSPHSVFGFIGISYVTFRALDVIFSIHDGVVKQLHAGQFFAFLFFFPTVSAGPIDRYRRFGLDWNRQRSRAEFVDDVDFAVQRIFRGFLYKFILAALIHGLVMDPLETRAGFLPCLGYMYAYTFYLFFDFAGYSAFAVGVSRLLGVKTPENFDLPFLSKNIRDFWTRWHISLSFWFRDHVHLRFQLAAVKGKWFKGKHTANYLGILLTFVLMGIWHGLEWHYIVYGLYHAALLCGYDAFARWNKQRKLWPESAAWRVGNMVLTFHVVAFGLLIFSGRLIPPAPPERDEVLQNADTKVVEGYAWDKALAGKIPQVDIYVDYGWIARVPADLYREELDLKGYGHGRVGFRYELPAWVHDGAPHIIEARSVSDNRVLGGSPKPVTAPADEAPKPVPTL